MHATRFPWRDPWNFFEYLKKKKPSKTRPFHKTFSGKMTFLHTEAIFSSEYYIHNIAKMFLASENVKFQSRELIIKGHPFFFISLGILAFEGITKLFSVSSKFLCFLNYKKNLNNLKGSEIFVLKIQIIFLTLQSAIGKKKKFHWIPTMKNPEFF